MSAGLPKRKRTLELQLEVLEDRTVPATFPATLHDWYWANSAPSTQEAVPAADTPIVYVNDGWSNRAAGSDPDGKGPATSIGVDAFATLQAAIDAVVEGGAVKVEEGSYAGGINVNKSVTIDFFNTKEAGVPIIKGGSLAAFTGNPDATGAFAITADGVTISRLSLRGTGNPLDSAYGIYIVGAHGSATIQNNTISGFATSGIFTEAGGGSSDNVIASNQLTSIPGIAIHLQAGGKNTVDSNRIVGGHANLTLDSQTNVTVQGNTFSKGDIGIEIFEPSATPNAAQISFNNITAHALAGLVYNGSTPITAENNFWGTTRGPTITGNLFGNGDKITEAVDGAVNFGPWIGLPFSHASRIYTTLDATVIINPGARVALVHKDNLFASAKGTIKNGRLSFQAPDSARNTITISGPLAGPLTVTVKIKNDRFPFTVDFLPTDFG